MQMLISVSRFPDSQIWKGTFSAITLEIGQNGGTTKVLFPTICKAAHMGRLIWLPRSCEIHATFLKELHKGGQHYCDDTSTL